MGLQKCFELFYIKILVSFFLYEVAVSKITCSPGIETAGYTVPQGDITIEYGNPLDIMCIVNSNNHSNVSSFLSFTRNSENIPPEMINVVNSTAVKLHVDRPSLATGDTYSCSINTTVIVCMNRVTVGIKPQKVTDFKCIGYNYDNLTCTWTTPENYIKTDYNLSFTLGEGRAFRIPSVCPEIISLDDTHRQCFWNASTTPPYRQVHEKFKFNLTMKNDFGDNHILYFFNHFAHVLSGPPENLTAVSKSPSSITLSWVVPLSMQTFPPGVHHRVLYQCEYQEKKWIDAGPVDVESKKNHVQFTVENLKYPHNLCDIRVSIRSAKALRDDMSMWSKNASITVRTRSRAPDLAPNTTTGSFEVISYGQGHIEYREVYVYWQQLQDVDKNGPEFKYIVIEENDDSLRAESTNAYVKYKDLLHSKSYTFHIWSQNVNGTSSYHSTVHVPREMDRVRDPESITKVEHNSGLYELIWAEPRLKPNEVIKDYTLFVCHSEKERPFQCGGMLTWEKVPAHVRSHNLTVAKNQTFQFAIAANTERSSSGMIWAACTVIHNKKVGKMKLVWINRVGSTFIEVGWRLDCADRIGLVEGYIVYYCPIKSPSDPACSATTASETFYGTTVQSGNITNLNPYATYMLTISVITKHTTFSQQSDPLYITTLEAAPSTPLNLIPNRLTNTSISVSWSAPKALNGVLKFYKVVCANEAGRIVVEVPDQSYTFANLTSYVNYTISVSACTVACSPEREIVVLTEMGYASKIRKPTVDRRNDTSISITWNKPSQPAGKNDYYIVKVLQKHKSGNKTLTYNATSCKHVIENCGDSGKYNTFYVSVRAVNIADNKTFEGPWSDELENYCYTPINYIMYLLLFVVIFILVGIGFLFTRLYHRCKIMRDVEVKLPPGLAPVVADHTLVPWSTEKHQDRNISRTTPDEELLLVKMSEGRNFSGDSSGCSSGHESVTSSLESGTHISSSSDSGTEQPGNYCALGVNSKEEPSYIPVAADSKLSYKGSCDDPSNSSPYVMTGEAVKSINPGYIPFNQTEPVEKSSGYVVAGIKNPNGYIPFNQTEPVSRNTGYVVAGIKNCKLD